MLSLPKEPELGIEFIVVNEPLIDGPSDVAARFGRTGGGVEFWTIDLVAVQLLTQWELLR